MMVGKLGNNDRHDGISLPLGNDGISLPLGNDGILLLAYHHGHS